MKNNIIVAVVAVFVGLVAGFWLFNSPAQVNLGGTSSVGATANSAKIASITMAPLTASATTTSILNTDSIDRTIESTFVSCSSVGTSKTYLTGTGLLQWTLTIATTSASGVGLQANSSFITTIATSTGFFQSASTTEPLPSQIGRLWPTGTYLTFNFNATNTAACLVGVHYLLL